MKTIRSSIAAGSLLAALALAQQQPRYRVIDLGTLGGMETPASCFGTGSGCAGARCEK